MSQLKSIKISTDQGEATLPSVEELYIYTQKKYKPTLYLDANVCLFLSHYYNESSIREEIKHDLFVLIEYFQKNRIAILPDYGILELVYDKNTFVFNKFKYDEIVEKVLYCFQLPIKNHKENFQRNLFKVSYRQDYTSYNKLNRWGSYFFVSYTTLLKIYTIAKKSNPSKETLLKNLKEFLKWCDETLDNSMALEIFIALKIFGGYSNFKKMIALDVKKGVDDILKAIKGTVWDLIHVRLIHEGLKSESMKSYLVSDDNNLNILLKAITLQSVNIFENGSVINTLTGSFETAYSESILQEEIDKLLQTFFKTRQNKINKNSVKPEISSLFPETKILELEIENLNKEIKQDG